LLFALNLHSLKQSELAQRDADLAQFQDEPQPGKVVSLRIPRSPAVLEFCGCPAGSYMMGSPEEEKECFNSHEGKELAYSLRRSGADRRVPVHFAGGFWIGRTTVTFEQWMAVVGSHPRPRDEYSRNGLPVNRINWNEAMSFCEKLNGLGLLPDGWRFTLPSEAQWEYACRAGTEGPYAGVSLDALGWFKGNSGGELHPTAQKQANPWGIFDMHGNVFEHCLDWHDKYLNPDVSLQGKTPGVERSIRGGCFHYGAEDCRSAYRRGLDDGAAHDDVGFRLCISPTVPKVGSAHPNAGASYNQKSESAMIEAIKEQMSGGKITLEGANILDRQREQLGISTDRYRALLKKVRGH